MTDSTSPKKPTVSTKMPPAIKVVLLILAVLVVLGILSTVFAGVYLRSVWSGLGFNGIKVDQAGNVEVKTEDGKVSISNKKELPVEWPSDVPTYPGSTIESTFKGESQLVNVFFSSQDEPDKVIQFYKEQLAAKGWQTDNSEGYFPLGGGIGIAQKDNRKLSVTILAANKSQDSQAKTAITIAVMQATPTPKAE